MAGYKEIRIGSLVSAIVTRVVFTLHCLLAFWRILETTTWNQFYLLLFIGLLLLLIETLITLLVRKGAEYKWLCPSVFFYLSTIVPCVWILELNQLEKRVRKLRNDTSLDLNHTDSQQSNFTRLGRNELIEGLHRLNIAEQQWVVVIEQLLLFLLILGRWALPKGNISRNELSQLLLVYIGMAADIIEFFETFKEDMVKTNSMLTMIILTIWSASLLQFSFVLTATGSRRSRGLTVGKNQKKSSGLACCDACSCCGTEVCGIVITMILQDGPFLVLRLLLLIKYDVKSYMHIFFTVKNSLVLLVLCYRLFVLFDNRHAALQELGALTGLQDGVIGVALGNSGGVGRARSDDELDTTDTDSTTRYSSYLLHQGARGGEGGAWGEVNHIGEERKKQTGRLKVKIAAPAGSYSFDDHVSYQNRGVNQTRGATSDKSGRGRVKGRAEMFDGASGGFSPPIHQNDARKKGLNLQHETIPLKTKK